jgi:hemolysin activation/secretion protein
MHDKRSHKLFTQQLQLHLVVLASSINFGTLNAQTINQVPDDNSNFSNITQTASEEVSNIIPNYIFVEKFEVIDINKTIYQGRLAQEILQIRLCHVKQSPQEIRVCNEEELADKEKFEQRTLELISNQRFSFTQLLQIASKVSELYARDGYSTSGAKVIIPDETQKQGQGIVKIQVIEGELEKTEVISVKRQRKNSQSQDYELVPNDTSRLQRDYVRSRLALATSKPLNVNRLQEALQILRLDPLIKSVTAELSAGTAPEFNVLKVMIEEADSFNTQLSINNGRSPSAGSVQRRIALNQRSLLGFGDSLSAGYTNTDGSNAYDFSYALPINSRNGTLSFNYSNTSSDVIEPPFDRLDILGNSDSYELTLRQPIIQNIKKETYQELTLGLTASRRESKTSLLDTPYPLSPGADDRGRTRISALRFFQEWTQQNRGQVVALRSQFSLGLGAFGSTINEPLEEVNEVIPDSRFFAWQVQGQWIRLLGSQGAKNPPLLLVRGNAQLANRALLPAEQFALGGFGSVRGYRQDNLLTDNGFFASAELQLPVLRVTQWQSVLQVIPFVDYGAAWNSSGRDNPKPNTLASVGLGLQWRQGDNFSARFDWGIPLVSVDSRDRTWQEQGLYFSVQYNPF